jgi:hypothetical protein
MSDSKQAHTQHEESDINVRAVLKFGAGLVVIAAVIHLAVWVLFRVFEGREVRNNPPQPLAADAPRVPPNPRLQGNPRLDLEKLREQEASLLNGYTWVDRDAGIVRIPIAEAMRLTVERGLPVRQPPEAVR